MKKLFTYYLFALFLLITKSSSAQAIYDPLSYPNNKIGIHILFTDELSKAKELVNSTGGDWGYVTTPIQAGDKDLDKWQKFMDEAKSFHLIPIVRLATEGDFFNKSTWKKPTDSDIVDFANFLDSLNWPIKNRYIIVFNEVNRADEWEGIANPKEYAQLLSFAVTSFKTKNQDFFIISSGMDNASITTNGTFSEYDYFKHMDDAVPGIFNQIDGFSSHSYPNPGFSQPPSNNTSSSISSFLYEINPINQLSNKKLPIFITETGWDQTIPGNPSAKYFKEALDTTWSDPNIVAITPFLLNSGPGPFEKFSFFKNNGDKNDVYMEIQNYKKFKGKPIKNKINKVLGEDISTDLPVKDFSTIKTDNTGKNLKFFVKWFFLPF